METKVMDDGSAYARIRSRDGKRAVQFFTVCVDHERNRDSLREYPLPKANKEFKDYKDMRGFGPVPLMKNQAIKGPSKSNKGTLRKGKSSTQESPIKTDEEWLRVWLYKRHQKEKMHLKGLRPEMYEECLLLYHKVYQGAPPNNEVGVHFAHGFMWQNCKGTEDSEDLVAWAVYAEGVIKMLRQHKTLNRKLEKWRSTNGPCLASEWKFNAENMPNYTDSTGTDYDWHTYLGGHQFLGQAKEEILNKQAFGSMGTFGMSNVSSTTFFASTADVAAISNMKANAAEKLKEKQQCLEAIKIALDQSKTKRDEQVCLMRGATKIIERLNKDMEELKLHKAGLVPNESAMAKLETLIQIKKESLKDMGLDIEVHNLNNNLGEEAAQLQGQHDTLLWEVEVATGHLQFVETIINLFKSRIPVKPPVHLGWDNSCVQLCDCVACGMFIMQTVVTGVYMLRCQHPYHPLCFVTAYKSVDQCLFHGCEEPLKDALKLLALGEANMDEHVGTEIDPMEGIFGSPVDGIAHSQAGSSRKPNIDSMCGGCRDKNASQKQAEPAKNKDVEDVAKSFEKPNEKDTTMNLSDEDADLLILDVCGEILGRRKKRSNTEERATPKKKAKVASEPPKPTPGGKKSKEPSNAWKKTKLQAPNLKPPKPKSRKKLL
ncbi:hypothetical protein L7F22_053170 [Adiantum nelumboides]|nr:hypothetical protein [Adiantum nelumboides]